MKRSELVNLLIRDLIDTENSDNEFRVRFLLARCESVGMSPPERIAPRSEIQYDSDGEILCKYPVKYVSRTWEKEDD